MSSYFFRNRTDDPVSSKTFVRKVRDSLRRSPRTCDTYFSESCRISPKSVTFSKSLTTSYFVPQSPARQACLDVTISLLSEKDTCRSLVNRVLEDRLRAKMFPHHNNTSGLEKTVADADFQSPLQSIPDLQSCSGSSSFSEGLSPNAIPNCLSSSEEQSVKKDFNFSDANHSPLRKRLRSNSSDSITHDISCKNSECFTSPVSEKVLDSVGSARPIVLISRRDSDACSSVASFASSNLSSASVKDKITLKKCMVLVEKLTFPLLGSDRFSVKVSSTGKISCLPSFSSDKHIPHTTGTNSPVAISSVFNDIVSDGRPGTSTAKRKLDYSSENNGISDLPTPFLPLRRRRKLHKTAEDLFQLAKQSPTKAYSIAPQKISRRLSSDSSDDCPLITRDFLKLSPVKGKSLSPVLKLRKLSSDVRNSNIVKKQISTKLASESNQTVTKNRSGNRASKPASIKNVKSINSVLKIQPGRTQSALKLKRSSESPVLQQRFKNRNRSNQPRKKAITLQSKDLKESKIHLDTSLSKKHLSTLKRSKLLHSSEEKKQRFPVGHPSKASREKISYSRKIANCLKGPKEVLSRTSRCKIPQKRTVKTALNLKARLRSFSPKSSLKVEKKNKGSKLLGVGKKQLNIPKQQFKNSAGSRKTSTDSSKFKTKRNPQLIKVVKKLRSSPSRKFPKKAVSAVKLSVKQKPPRCLRHSQQAQNNIKSSSFAGKVLNQGSASLKKAASLRNSNRLGSTKRSQIASSSKTNVTKSKGQKQSYSSTSKKKSSKMSKLSSQRQKAKHSASSRQKTSNASQTSSKTPNSSGKYRVSSSLKKLPRNQKRQGSLTAPSTSKLKLKHLMSSSSTVKSFSSSKSGLKQHKKPLKKIITMTKLTSKKIDPSVSQRPKVSAQSVGKNRSSPSSRKLAKSHKSISCRSIQSGKSKISKFSPGRTRSQSASSKRLNLSPKEKDQSKSQLKFSSTAKLGSVKQNNLKASVRKYSGKLQSSSNKTTCQAFVKSIKKKEKKSPRKDNAKMSVKTKPISSRQKC